jgi:hypothetical protein
MSISGSPLSSHFPEDLGLGERFWYWRGASGRKYIHSVYPADACPPLPGAVYVAVRHRAWGREAIGIGRFPSFWEGRCDSRTMIDLLAPDADEVHVHLLARNDLAADAVLADLQRAELPAVGLDAPSTYSGFHESGQLAMPLV